MCFYSAGDKGNCSMLFEKTESEAICMIQPTQSWKNKNSHYLSALGSDWYRTLAIIQNELCCATYDFYRAKQMKTLFLPVTTNSISSPMGFGSDSLPVEIELFGQKTYLADSMQFMLEYGCRYFSEGCFYLMPSFRGEHADERHLCQFYHSEAEIPGHLADVIALVEEYIRYLCAAFLQNTPKLIEERTGNLDHIKALEKKQTFPRISFDEAVALLRDVDGGLKKYSNGLLVITSIGEEALLKRFNGVVWLVHMDKHIVPFYQSSSDGIHADCADLLLGIGETVGCGERHYSGKEVVQALEEHKVDVAPYEWYIKMKEEYPMKTAGFGMGTERFILWLLQHNDIRDCQLLPRFNGEIFIP